MRLYLIVASLIPVLLLIGYGVRKTNGSWRNPALWIGFLAGSGGGVIAYFAEQLLLGLLHIGATPTLGSAAYKAFLIAAIPEEVVKFAALLVVTILYLEGRRLQDVLLLAVGVGMGFAGLENMLYLGHTPVWAFVAVIRSVSAVPAHGILGLTMGALIIATVLSESNRWLGLLLALFVPILLHGVYDTFGMLGAQGTMGWTFPATVLSMAVSGLLAVGLCNMVLPEAAALDQSIDAATRRGRGRPPKWLARLAGSFLFLLLAVVRFTHYDATVCWMAAFLGVLPLILAFDLIFTWLRGPIAAAAVPDPELTPGPLSVSPSAAGA